MVVSSKKNFVLRIDEETFKALEKWAGDEFRSVNGQLEWIIDQALKDSGRKKKTDNQGKSNDKKQL
jgi:hypothetical protein